MVAVAVVPDPHVTDDVRFCVLLSLYVPVAVNCCVSPLAADGFAGVTVIDCSVGGPDETTRFTCDPVFAIVPAAGLSLITLPDATELLDIIVTVPTTSPALSISVVAALCVSPTTFGTATCETIVVESVAVADAAPPPLTVTELTCGEVAFAATSTVTVIA
jgi:hypothetical protein